MSLSLKKVLSRPVLLVCSTGIRLAAHVDGEAGRD